MCIEDYFPLAKAIGRNLFVSKGSLPSFDGDDMVGAGALALCEAYPGYREDLDPNPKRYLGRKIKWGILNAYRKQFPFSHSTYNPDVDQIAFLDLHDETDEDGTPLHETLPGCDNSDQAECIDLQDAIDKLTPREALLVRRCFWDGDTVTDVANELGVTPTGAAVSMRKALQKLRILLDGGEVRKPGRQRKVA